MRCPRCGADNAADSRFCGQCGAALARACPRCGAANPVAHQFCERCGAPLAPAAEPASAPDGAAAAPPATVRGEMRLATVLDCDIVGSTPLTTRLGPEAMRDLVQRFLDASATEVRRYGGTIAQFQGDGFLALFGLPLAEEDHVRRALLAALAVQRAVAEGAADRGGVVIDVRIGIDTGLVYYGPVAESVRLEPTVIGETPIVAVRLQAEAAPDSVLISDETYRAARDYVRVEPVGALNLKGIAQPVVAYRLHDVSHRRSGLRERIPSRTARYVDRDSERQLLRATFAQLEDGHGRAVGIVGEPGIGKSRLLAEFRREVDDSRVNWVGGRCLSYGTQIPYLLVLDTLRSNCGIAETDPPATVAEKLSRALRTAGLDPAETAPVLLQLLQVEGERTAPALSNPEAVKTQAFEILRQLCLRASRVRPLVLALEDLHWVDRISEEFLGFLAQSLSNARLLLLATYRPGYRPPWGERSFALQIALSPLANDDSLQVVHSVLAPEARAAPQLGRVAEQIVAKADGNPLFLEELALHASATGDAPADLMVPNTIHEVVMARIDRLPEEAKQLLQIAAVAGHECPLRLLRAVAPPGTPVETALGALSRLEFLDEWPDDDGTIYVFRHALTQETVYGSLLERQRRAYHRTVGEALERLYGDRAEEIAELLALHFGRSKTAEKAIDYAILAAEKAQRRWANADALAYFEDALARLDRLPDSAANRLRRIDAILKQGEVKFALGQHAEHMAALDRISPLVAAAAEPRRRATWHYWRGFLHTLTGGRLDIAAHHCREAATVAAGAGFDDMAAFAESCLAQINLFSGRLREAVEVGEHALAIFERQGNLWWTCRTMWHLSPAAIALGNWDKSLDYCRRALDYAAILKDTRLRIVGLWRLGGTYIQRGEPEIGVRYCDEALALAPLPFDRIMAAGMRGYGRIRLGQIAPGIADLGEVVAWFAASGLRYGEARFALWLAEGHLLDGARDAAQSLAEAVLNTSRLMDYRQFEGIAHWLVGVCLGADDRLAAEPHIESAIDLLGRIGARNDLARALVTSAALRQSAADVAGAHRRLDEAGMIFKALGASDEVRRVEAAHVALADNRPITLLAGARE